LTTGHANSPILYYFWYTGGTAATAPPLFRPGNPALCGSRPLVTHIIVD